MVAIIGGTGNIGSELVKALLAKGESVRLLVRDGDISRVPQGVESRTADLGDPATLDSGLEGAERAFLVSSTDERAIELQNNFIDACARAGVKHLVKSSSYGADQPTSARLMVIHQEVEKHLLESGLPYTLVRPNLFHQGILASLPVIKTGFLYQPQGDGAVSSVDVRDIAAVACAALTESGHEGKAYELTGPEALDSNQVAEIISKVAGYQVTYVDVSAADYIASLKGYGLSDFMAHGLAELYEYYKEGHAARVTDDVQRVTGSAPRSFEAWALESAAAFAR